uniref:Proteasome subunit alpha type n=1 Tax=Compsopogon caeruleus TaxID=31354 RepID=A0A7S1XC26_9RHOD|mmetsp:Transcript_15003/g.30506  ORF Transcript_15003/g.30506 Transcript_15003/m.30506 type:complete len:256 (+) Transcript_15003:67-834(+)|eukprot:CAMPEP_0184690422 /NCGR_PEP_ID=MMETSP0312-20130426/31219_1 /TAXON_ID=31354 /ORGANISM="Compsopogon coeruleus, Strain SAG 36.94" /LENGTH=255 /DNA_ID=CAMNT_0027147915 /DNA_START=57 /DNA_END=824 /DNA_ORIENTATION=+
MSSIGTGYDLSSTTFSPDGRVFQVEYAHKAVENSGTVLGVACKDGVVLAVEKIVTSKMLVPGTLRRLHILDQHAALGVCGLLADGRQLVNVGRNDCANYLEVYQEVIPGRLLADRLAMWVHMYTMRVWIRPFGCSVLIASYEETEGPRLYMIEPSGMCYRYYGCAVGKGKTASKTQLEKFDFAQLSARDAIKELAKILLDAHDDAGDKSYEVEMLWVCDESGKKSQMVPKDLVEEATRLAKEARQRDDEDMDEDS